MDRTKQWIFFPWVQLMLFCLGSLTLFFPELQRTFASDDFEVIGRIAWEKHLMLHGTFRPLSDLTLSANYLIGGWRPAGYYLFNILVHGINSFLVYRFCLRWKWDRAADRQGTPAQQHYALLAALFFLAYPFHSEGIDWILGRGASLCTLFGLLALLVAISGLSRQSRIIWAGLFYFIGMTAYEPVILLPFFCLIVLYIHKASRSELLQWAIVLVGVFLLYILVRVIVAGTLTGEYGGGFFTVGPERFTTNLVKVAGRLILPPSDHTGRQVTAFAGVCIASAGALYVFIMRARSEQRLYLGALVLLLAISCVIPVVTAVSTRTSESDRLLYLPSVFLCCTLAFLLVTLVKRKQWLYGGAALILVYMVIYLEQTNTVWVRADAITREILRTPKKDNRTGKGRIFIINLPDEEDGAFIFRHGFPEAWRLANRTAPQPIVIDHLSRDQALLLPDSIGAAWDGGILHIPPAVNVRAVGGDSLLLTGIAGQPEWRIGAQDRVFYWNKQKLIQLFKR